MAETSKEELMTEEFEMKVEKASITGNSLPLTLVEEMSIVYIKEEDAKIEGIIIRNNNILKIKYNFQSFFFFKLPLLMMMMILPCQNLNIHVMNVSILRQYGPT